MHAQPTRRTFRLALVALSLLAAPGARAQIAGENVNMVSGVEWPGGDPFLQRQNEPTVAVSSANPQHLMAGANDYRSVDVAVPAEHFARMKSTPDAWLGVFKSLDGGQTWRSTLLPGFLGDPSPAGAASPLQVPLQLTRSDGSKESLDLPACADPVMRAGTDGMFYYAGINFSRDKRASRLFVARYLDLNDRENGDASKAEPGDPIRYVDTVVISANLPARPNVFIDKPWIAVDVPRAGAATCSVTTRNARDEPVTRSFAGGTVYAAWAEFEQPDEQRSTIMFTWSSNCGQTWVPPFPISSKNSVLSQGVSLAVEPVSGRVYVAWRRAATPLAPKQTDAIMATRSEGRKRHFSHARVVAPLAANPFDQGTSYGSFRSNAFPSLAISSDGAQSWAHVAYTDRQPAGDARVVLSSARVHPRPTGDDDDDDPEENDDETRVAWSRPVVVDAQPAADDANHLFTRGHQFMPALTASQGRLVLTWYDSRFDHTRRYFRPRTPVNGEFPGGKFYDEELAPIGDYFQQLEADYRAGAPVEGPVFNRWLADSFGNVDPVTGKVAVVDQATGALVSTTLSSWVKVRHSVEVRAAMADAGPNPAFRAVTVSRYPFGASGEGNPAQGTALTVPRFDVKGAQAAPGSDQAALLTVVDGGGGLQHLAQFQMNTPNFPIFKNGTVAFIGDYIDVAGPQFVVKNGAWSFNTARSATPVFHAVWTSNQDVRTPPIDPSTGLPAWDQYVPPGMGGALSKYDRRSTTQACDPDFPAFAGSRDQNIYTSRITDGLSVSTPQNAKPLAEPDASGQLVPVLRSFVISANNATARPVTVAFSASLPAGRTGVELSWSAAGSYTATPAVSGIVVPAFSSVSQTLFARLAGGGNLDPSATILARVDQTGACATASSGCASATLTLNPPVALATLLQPEGVPSSLDVRAGEQLRAVTFDRFLSDPNWSNPNWSNSNPNPNWSNPNWSNPNWSNLGYTGPNWSNPNWSNLGFTNPNWSNPNWSNPNWSNPNWSNPNWSNLGVTNPNWSNPNWSNPNWSNPNWSNPNWSNPNWSNPNWSNPNWSNTAIADLNASVQNTGNTTTAYSVKLVRDESKPVSVTGPIQLLVTKIYETPTLDGCFVRSKPNFQLAVNVPDMPVVPSTASVDPRLDAATGFATVTLAPGERALITLRAQASLTQMADLGKAVAAATVPQDFPANTATYDAVRGDASSPVSLPGSLGTTTTLTPQGSTAFSAFRAAVSAGSGIPTGTVTFVRTRAGLSRTAAMVPLAAGVADVSISPVLAQGESLVAYYGGDLRYDPSTSAAYAPALSNTTVALTTSPTTWTSGPLTLTAQVSSLGPDMDMAPAVASGATVTFTVDGTPHTVAMTTGGGTRVSYTVPALGTGTHTVRAHFDGFGSFLPSDSVAITGNVSAPLLRVAAVFASGNQPQPSFGVVVSNAALAPVGGAVASVGALSCTTDTSGQCQMTLPSLPQGSAQTFTVSYAGATVTGSTVVPIAPVLVRPDSGTVWASTASIPFQLRTNQPGRVDQFEVTAHYSDPSAPTGEGVAGVWLTPQVPPGNPSVTGPFLEAASIFSIPAPGQTATLWTRSVNQDVPMGNVVPGGGFVVASVWAPTRVVRIVSLARLATPAVDVVRGAAVDAAGNLFVAGSTNGALDDNAAFGGSDFFLTKYGPGGARLWTRVSGTAGTEWAYGLALDAAGAAYVVGYRTPSGGGPTQGLLVKYDTNGVLQWERAWGSYQVGTSVAIDTLRLVVHVGGADSSTGTMGATIDTFDLDGHPLRSVRHPNTLSALAYAIAVQRSTGDVYLAGELEPACQFSPCPPSYPLQAFLSRFDSDGRYFWTSQVDGGTGTSAAYAVAVDAFAVVRLAGVTNNDSTGVDGFLAAYTAAGNRTRLDVFGAPVAVPVSLAVDPAGNAYLGGYGGVGSLQAGFVWSFDSAGTPRFTTSFLSTGATAARAIAVNPAGTSLYVTGEYTGALYGVPAASTAEDAFVLKRSTSATGTWE